jgi:hypothetical protein
MCTPACDLPSLRLWERNGRSFRIQRLRRGGVRPRSFRMEVVTKGLRPGACARPVGASESAQGDRALARGPGDWIRGEELARCAVNAGVRRHKKSQRSAARPSSRADTRGADALEMRRAWLPAPEYRDPV